MIIGIGTDIIDIRRIENTINKYGHRFINKIFTQQEITESNTRFNKNSYYAKRFSAKESVSKAFGSGINKNLSWQDIEILNDKNGKPFVNILNNNMNNYSINISISDEYPYAQTFVIISTLI